MTGGEVRMPSMTVSFFARSPTTWRSWSRTGIEAFANVTGNLQ
ncbi:hypothetical protein [Amycolatopsis sp. NPDC051061]